MDNYEELFIKRMNGIGTLAEKAINSSNAILDKTFENGGGYQRSKLYNQDGTFLQDIDIRFQRHSTYSIVLGNQTDYWIQFRPDFFPEIIYPYDIQHDTKDVNSNWEHYGFYVDVKNRNGSIDKYLIIGKEDRDKSIRYDALKCNWFFQWKDSNNKLHKVLGVLRNKQVSDNVKASGYVPVIQGGLSIYLPYNTETSTITYNTRFILSADMDVPKVYEVTNLYNTFPMGVLKLSVSQVLSNNRDDGNTGIAGNNFKEEDISSSTTKGIYEAELSCRSPKIVYKGSPCVITYKITKDNEEINERPIWKYYLDDTETPQEISEEELTEYLDITYTDNQVKISYPRAKSSDFVGYILIVAITDNENNYFTNIKLKVTR